MDAVHLSKWFFKFLFAYLTMTNPSNPACKDPDPSTGIWRHLWPSHSLPNTYIDKRWGVLTSSHPSFFYASDRCFYTIYFLFPFTTSPYQWLMCKTPCSLIILSWIQVIQHIRIYWENRQTREYRHKIPLCQKAWTGQLFLFWSVNNYRGPGQRGFARQRRGN